MPRTRSTVRTALVAVALMIAALAALAPPAPVAAHASNPDAQYDVAAIMVQNYFDAINEGDYRTAYGYLGTEIRRNQSYTQFVSLFRGLDYEDLTVDDVEYRGLNSVVYVRLTRYNTDGSEISYAGTYTVRAGSSIYDSPIVAINLVRVR